MKIFPKFRYQIPALENVTGIRILTKNIFHLYCIRI